MRGRSPAPLGAHSFAGGASYRNASRAASGTAAPPKKCDVVCGSLSSTTGSAAALLFGAACIAAANALTLARISRMRGVTCEAGLAGPAASVGMDGITRPPGLRLDDDDDDAAGAAPLCSLA